jgi:succinoglycan biosynthesis protein ExoO
VERGSAVSDGLISVIMPVFNAELLVGKAIRSCLNQTYPHWELEVVDDASTDSSRDIVRSFGDERIRLHTLEGNCGPGPARNVALDAARGEWITVLDADDLFHYQRLEFLISQTQTYGHQYIYLDRLLRWASLNDPPQTLMSEFPRQVNPVRTQSVAQWVEADSGGKPFFHASLLRRPGGIRYPNYRGVQDTGFAVELAQENSVDFLILPQRLYVYRKVPGSLSTKSAPRLAEVESAYIGMRDVCAGNPALLASVQRKLDRLALERLVLDCRQLVSDRRFVQLAVRLAQSPHLARQMPTYLRAWFRSSVKRRNGAERIRLPRSSRSDDHAQ